ncbi:MAG: biotin--[acetyl-CoA-carboxylase] ligase [Candidatus Omnitrophica bacterium]|nr:biotin--[acetyl-CoA-carboxylase] ligase [Candidatus Omnitrophota bacterium]
MEEKIIGLLKRAQGYLSGEEISDSLKISRQGLWKHIQSLKEFGYDIAAVPHLGYRLISSPDRLFDFEVTLGLHTKILGRKILYFDSLSSTMDTAMQLGLKGVSEGTLVLAETQTKGRGRLGRIWVSPKYKGIYLSLILRPKLSPNQAPILTLLTAASICEAIKEVTGIAPQIKWPNDILVHHRKVGGILTELNAETDEVNFIVIGLGLNVNNEKKSLVSGATSLKEQKKENINRLTLLQEILLRLEKNYLTLEKKGSRPIIDKWREYNITLGQRVKIYSQREHIEGEAVDIDIDGALLVRRDTGLTQKVISGDVVHCR